MLRLLHERPIPARDLRRVRAALDADPVATCMIAARVEGYGLDRSALGGNLWTAGDPADSLCFAGANLMPLLGSVGDIRYFAERAARGPRTSSSVVGRQEYVLPLWSELEAAWGSPRAVREEQPLMALRGSPTVRPHQGVRRARAEELEAYLRASIAMFTAEVGMDPCAVDGGVGYRRRVLAGILTGHAFVLFDGDEVAFKAEIGAMSTRVGQIQGVWVRPDLRGRGLGTRCTAALAQTIARTGRVASLYVNDFNTPARRAYERIGFRRVATFATIMVT